MIRAALCFLLAFGLSFSASMAQLLPPARYDGFVYPAGKPVKSETILIEAFLDPVCSDSRDAWPQLKLALEHYGSRVALAVHLLPLPYHDNAYVVSRALHIVNSLNANATFKLLEGIFKHQAMFYNAQTQLLSRYAVVNEIIKLGTDTLGNSYYSGLKSGFSKTESDLTARVSFKYSASRGVSATPTFYVNGFVLPNAGSPLDFEEWRNTIDPLVQAPEMEIEDVHSSI